MPASDPVSIRLPQDLYDRLFSVIAATGNEYNKSQIVVLALKTYFAILDYNPAMLEHYDRDRDTSVTHSEDL